MIRSTLLTIPVLALAFATGCERDASDDQVSDRADDAPPCNSVTAGACEEGDDGAAEEEGGEDDGDDTECGESGEHEDTDTDTDTDGGDDTEGDDEGGEADLPYDIEADVGDTVDLAAAFDEKGPQPQAILEVTMDGGDWRLMELQSGTPFVVEDADCDHEGNRDTGRDRIFVTWRNPNGTEATDHIDLRYCGV